MSDRFGPSLDCKKCGQSVGFCELDEEGLCPDCSDEIENQRMNDRDNYLEDMRLFKDK